VRLTTLDNIDITGLEQFHKKICLQQNPRSLSQFFSTDKLRDRITRLVNILLQSSVSPPLMCRQHDRGLLTWFPT